MRLQQTRIRTAFVVSLLTPPVYALVAWQAWQRGVAWVSIGCSVGLALSIGTAWRTRDASAPGRPPYGITAFLVVFLGALVCTGYGGGYGAAWLLCTPPLALLILGTRVGAAVTAVMFAILLIGLGNHDMVSEQTVNEPFRLRLAAAYLVIAATCLAYSAATDWYGRKLDEASAEIESLRALLTMCAHCKRVRVEGEWRTIESFLDREQKLRFSHGICTHCADEHYPELRADEPTADDDDVTSSR
ncbi:MAG: hypothetical protein R3F29_01045 [Planctomycetota bacterium]